MKNIYLLRIWVLISVLILTFSQVWAQTTEVANNFPSQGWWVEHLIEIILGLIISGITIYFVCIKIVNKNNSKNANTIKQGNDSFSENSTQQGNGNSFQSNQSPKTNPHQEGVNNIQNIINQFGDNYYQINSKKEDPSNNVQTKSDTKTQHNNTFDFYNCAKIGVAILYAAYLSHKKGKPFPPQLCGDPNYVHGFLVAMEINHPDEFRLNIILGAQPMMKILVFDKSYFKGVKEAAQMAKYTAVKPIIENIENYFNVKS